MRDRSLVLLFAGVLLATIAAVGSGDAGGRAARLEAGAPGVAMDDGWLVVALPLENAASIDVSRVVITDITIPGWALVRPAAMPLEVGQIAGRSKAVLQLAFERTRPRPVDPGVLRLRGTFMIGRQLRGFRLTQAIPEPQPTEGSRDARRFVVPLHRVEGGNFPPQHAGVRPEEIDETDLRPVPEGKRGREAETPPPPVELRGMAVREPTGGAAGAPGLENPIVFVRAGSYENTSDIPDPSGASVDLYSASGVPQERVVLLGGNLYTLLSTDGGASFTMLDPTTIFPPIPLDDMPEDIGMCCDTNVIYVPSINRFVWTILTRGSEIAKNEEGDPINGYNRVRVAFASPQQVIASGGTAWSYWDMTTKLFGFGKPVFLDHPDVSFTNSYLHVSIQALNGGGLFVTRVPLSNLVSGSTINIEATDAADGLNPLGGRLAHEVPDAAYWFGHVHTGHLQIFEWLDDSTRYGWVTCEVTPWANADYVSLTPDGTNWLVANTSSVRGATFKGTYKQTVGDLTIRGRQLVIAWGAARDATFPQPYVRVAVVTKATVEGPVPFPEPLWSVENGPHIWNPDFAFHHGQLSTNTDGETGVSVAAGGGGDQATAVTGFLGESPLFYMNVSARSLDRWGDYTAIRRHSPDGRLFSVSDYALLLNSDPKKGPTAVHQYRLFGRTF